MQNSKNLWDCAVLIGDASTSGSPTRLNQLRLTIKDESGWVITFGTAVTNAFVATLKVVKVLTTRLFDFGACCTPEAAMDYAGHLISHCKATVQPSLFGAMFIVSSTTSQCATSAPAFGVSNR